MVANGITERRGPFDMGVRWGVHARTIVCTSGRKRASQAERSPETFPMFLFDIGITERGPGRRESYSMRNVSLGWLSDHPSIPWRTHPLARWSLPVDSVGAGRVPSILSFVDRSVASLTTSHLDDQPTLDQISDASDSASEEFYSLACMVGIGPD